MAISKKQIKNNGPVAIRYKALSNGGKSIYFDIYKDGKRSYLFKGLHLVPETDAASKAQNKNTLQAANAIKAQLTIDITNGEAGIKPKASKILLVDWAKAVQERMFKKGTVGAKLWTPYIAALNVFKADKVMLKDVDKAFCVNFSNFLSKEYVSEMTGRHLESSTASRLSTYLNRTLKEAVKADLITTNPYDKLDLSDKIKVTKNQREFLTLDEVRMLEATPCRHDIVKRAFLFSCYCGLRISDIKALKWGNIYRDGETYRLEIVMKKTQTPIYMALSKPALKWLPERGGAADTGTVFSMPPHATLDRTLERWTAKAGIAKHITFHCARHTFATMTLSLGADLYTVSKLLGHSNIQTTQIYAQIVNRKKDEAINLLNEAYNA